MKYLAILFMCNDEERAKFVATNFKKHNPDIHLIVYNGGTYSDIKSICDEYIQGNNLWHTKTRGSPGSFSYEWFEFLFKKHKQYNPDYIIFLETDVLTTRKIQEEPRYDVSGVCVGCGTLERIVMYYYWGDYLKDKDFNGIDDWTHKLHTGMGGTALSKNFFQQCEQNLHLVRKCYDMLSFCSYQDLILTLLARYSGCSIGDWSEVSDTRGTHRLVNDRWLYEPMNQSCALIHNYKI